MEKTENTEYCSKCGIKLPFNSKVCLNCGNILHQRKSDGITLGIIGIFFGFLFPIVGFILGWIGYSHATYTDNKKGKILNQIALLLSAIMTVFYLMIPFW